MGIDFVHFGLELGVIFEETMGMYEHICHFNLFQMDQKERVISEFKMDLKKSCLNSGLNSTNTRSEKRVWI